MSEFDPEAAKELADELSDFGSSKRVLWIVMQEASDALLAATVELAYRVTENQRFREALWMYEEGLRAVRNGLTTPEQFMKEALAALAETPDTERGADA